MFDDKIEFGKMFGIPIVLDYGLILLAVVFGYSYFTSGNLAMISYGLLLFAGVVISILLHEFGHAFAGAYYGVRTSHIELHGLGGLCHFTRPLPPERKTNIAVLLAGPAVTAVLWLVFKGLGMMAYELPANAGFVTGVNRIGGLMNHLSVINFYLLIFNLLPAHPLDGGRSLAHLISKWVGYDRAMRFVAYTGTLVTAWLVWQGVQGNTFMLLIALFLFMSNLSVLDAHGGPRWRRGD